MLTELNNYSEPEGIVPNWSDHDDNSEFQNIEQFIYWHLLKMKQVEMDNTTFAEPPQ